MAKMPVAGLLAVALLILPAAGARAEAIGTASAVHPNAEGKREGGARRVLEVGNTVLFRETITTGATGSVQLLFKDKTTLTVGPNSHLVIDEFVYDPASETGRMAATLTRGALRFVGGQTSHTGGATIRTPVTTLGVRGGVASVRHDAKAGTRVINHFGKVSVESAAGSELIRRSGFATTIGGGTDATLRRISRAEMQEQNAALMPPRQAAARKAAAQAAQAAAASSSASSSDAASVFAVQAATTSSAAAGSASAGGQGAATRAAEAAIGTATTARQAALLPDIAPADAVIDGDPARRRPGHTPNGHGRGRGHKD
jgi:hypothetical protein